MWGWYRRTATRAGQGWVARGSPQGLSLALIPLGFRPAAAQGGAAPGPEEGPGQQVQATVPARQAPH